MHFPHQTNEVVCNYFVLGLVIFRGNEGTVYMYPLSKVYSIKTGRNLFSDNFFLTEFFYLLLTFCPSRKAIRATVILMPLLGLTNLIMLFNPNDGGSYASVYQVTNVVLHSNQVSDKV